MIESEYEVRLHIFFLFSLSVTRRPSPDSGRQAHRDENSNSEKKKSFKIR